MVPSKRFPQGIKAKFVLLDLEKGEGRLLVDNHEPFGFHMHPNMSDNHDERIPLVVKDHEEALEVFLTEVERILSNE